MLGCCYHYLRAPPLPELTWASDGRRRRGRGGTGRVLKTLDVPKAWPPCPCPLSLQSTTHRQSEMEGSRDLLKVTEWLLVKKKKKKKDRGTAVATGSQAAAASQQTPHPSSLPSSGSSSGGGHQVLQEASRGRKRYTVGAPCRK